MGIGDIIHDNAMMLLLQLKSQYSDYVHTRKEIIVEMIAAMLLATHLSDRMALPQGSYINRDIDFWKSYALELYDREEEEDEDEDD